MGETVLKYLSLRQKFIYLVMTIAAVILLVSSVLLMVTEVYMFRKEMIKDLTMMAKITASNTSVSLTFNDVALARNILSSINVDDSVEDAVIYGKDGEFLLFRTFQTAFPESFP